jgi:hypothetical protein
MSVKIEKGLWTTIWAPKTASTVIYVNSLVSLDDGYIAPGDSTTGAADEPVLGVWLNKTIAATDADYASATLCPVLVPIGPAQIRATVTGTLTAASAGMSYDLSDSVTVNAGATTYGTVTCTKYISATEGLFTISKSLYANVA